MTGATAVWFLGRRKKHQPAGGRGIKMTKSDGVREAQRAVQEAVNRQQEVSDQRGVVERVVSSLAEIRKENNFASKVRAAMGGDQ